MRTWPWSCTHIRLCTFPARSVDDGAKEAAECPPVRQPLREAQGVLTHTPFDTHEHRHSTQKYLLNASLNPPPSRYISPFSRKCGHTNVCIHVLQAVVAKTAATLSHVSSSITLYLSDPDHSFHSSNHGDGTAGAVGGGGGVVGSVDLNSEPSLVSLTRTFSASSIGADGGGGGGGGERRKMPNVLHFLVVLFEYFEEMALCRRKLVGMCRAGCACLRVSVRTRARFRLAMA